MGIEAHDIKSQAMQTQTPVQIPLEPGMPCDIPEAKTLTVADLHGHQVS